MYNYDHDDCRPWIQAIMIKNNLPEDDALYLLETNLNQLLDFNNDYDLESIKRGWNLDDSDHAIMESLKDFYNEALIEEREDDPCFDYKRRIRAQEMEQTLEWRSLQHVNTY